ncbi:Zn(II)2Cys6 transcription factor domain-containing protein [Rhodotorula paludigena]|uniref:Zn(II)2Cys6 transcription factor domain-containing protein n=1 Tax=Rhodotorula paludigena TaxID=86838 RepID=UPI003175A884
MPASSSRLGRKIHRESTGSRTPACTTCRERRVKCSGGSPCTACLRKAAWEGRPPPAACSYNGGIVPQRKTGPPPPELAATAPHFGAEASTSSAAISSATSPSAKGVKKGPLQKGLACLACKQRRVRCDGQKPACSACTKYNRAGQSCVYRADLYLQRQKEEEERARRSEEGAAEALHSHEEQTPVPEDGVSNDIQVDEQMPTSETEPPLVAIHGLPVILPPLPPLPAPPQSDAPIHSALFSEAPEYSPPAASFVPSADGYFGILHPRSSSLSSSCSSSTRDSLSLCNTQPSSPAFSASDLSVDWDLLSLSSCSSWPSPSTPWLLGGCARPHSLLRLTNYPPVPYPAPQPTAAAEQGAINPHWTEATSPLSIPPLELEGMSLWDHHHHRQPTACGAGDAMQAFAAQKDDTPMPGSMEQTLTLPMVPAFAVDWPAAG